MTIYETSRRIRDSYLSSGLIDSTFLARPASASLTALRKKRKKNEEEPAINALLRRLRSQSCQIDQNMCIRKQNKLCIGQGMGCKMSCLLVQEVS
jgi:coenzyme F420-reducing hydrogenase gamma subunit